MIKPGEIQKKAQRVGVRDQQTEEAQPCSQIRMRSNERIPK